MGDTAARGGEGGGAGGRAPPRGGNRGYRAVAPDHRGYGHSDAATSGYSIFHIVALFDSLTQGKVFAVRRDWLSAGGVELVHVQAGQGEGACELVDYCKFQLIPDHDAIQDNHSFLRRKEVGTPFRTTIFLRRKEVGFRFTRCSNHLAFMAHRRRHQLFREQIRLQSTNEDSRSMPPSSRK